MYRRVQRLISWTVAGAVAATIVAPPSHADERDLLGFCLENSKHCAVSVNAINEGWERHWNGDRPQVLASTYKVLILLAYAQSVANGAVTPDDTIDKEEWARYFSGGSTLSTSWDEIGQPDRPRLDDLARMMILNSDNSATDFFQAHLGKKAVRKAFKLFGWHDYPAPISSMFGLWQNLNGVGGTGNRVAMDYGGFDVDGYRKELGKHSKALKRNAFVESVREALCQQPPWVGGTPPCDRPQPGTTTTNFRILENNHFNRSTSRVYADLMRELLERTLLSDAAQEVVERNLDRAWLDRFPTLEPSFSRYGLKGGSLSTGDGPEILTWAHYLQTSSGGYVVVVFLQDLGDARNVPDSGDVNAFAQQFALNSAFRQEVRDAIDGAALPPELVPQLKKVKLKGGKNLLVKVKVFNSSPAPSERPVKVSLFLLDEAQADGAVAVDTAQSKALAGYKSKTITLRAKSDDAKGKFAVVMIDSDEEVEEQDEANNLTWQRLD